MWPTHFPGVIRVESTVGERTLACQAAGMSLKSLAPGRAGPVRRPLSSEPLGRCIDLPRIGCLLLRARAVARRELRHGVATLRAQACADHQDHAWPVASPHEGVLRPGWRVEEVPGSEASLLALDEQPALARENEERLLIRLGVIDAALARLEDGHVDPQLREFQ